MVVIDATMLMLLFRANVPARITDSKGRKIDYVKERLEYLVKTLEASKSKIIIPSPVLSELLVRATAQETQQIIEQVNKHAVFRIEPFETRAAIELAVMTRPALNAGDKRSGSGAPWAKIKFDRQITAIARVAQATVIYTDDENLAAAARVLSITTIGLGDLPLPPDTAQGKLPFEAKGPDAIDEIAEQTKSLEEPEGPDEEAPGAR
jgi:predicted nucleic acid-binding protein